MTIIESFLSSNSIQILQEVIGKSFSYGYSDVQHVNLTSKSVETSKIAISFFWESKYLVISSEWKGDSILSGIDYHSMDCLLSDKPDFLKIEKISKTNEVINKISSSNKVSFFNSGKSIQKIEVLNYRVIENDEDVSFDNAIIMHFDFKDFVIFGVQDDLGGGLFISKDPEMLNDLYTSSEIRITLE